MDLGVGQVTHSFLVIPECPYPLLGCNLLAKMKAQIHITDKGAQVKHPDGRAIGVFLTMPLEEEYHLHEQERSSIKCADMQIWLQQFPTAWAEAGGMGLAKHRPPVYVELKTNVDPVKVRQYPMTLEAKKGIPPHVRWLLQEGVPRPIQSTWNTPLLPVKKPQMNDYCPVQDL